MLRNCARGFKGSVVGLKSETLDVKVGRMNNWPTNRNPNAVTQISFGLRPYMMFSADRHRFLCLKVV